MRDPRPFPFDALPRSTRRDVATLRAVLRRLAPPPSLELPSPAWAGLLGAPLSARPSAPTVLSLEAAVASIERTSLCAVFAHPTAGALVLACDRPFALTLAQRALGAPHHDTASAHGPHDVLSPAHEGALFALLSHSAARVYAPSPPPVLRAVTEDAALALGALGSTATLLAWPFTVSLDALSARVTLLADARLLLRAPENITPWPERVRALPIALSLVVARAWYTAAEVASITVSEVFALDELRADLRGPATLRLGAHTALECSARICDAHTIELDDTPRYAMQDATESLPPIDPGAQDRLSALPVELTVEIARGTARVADIAAWRAGEIVSFDARIGEVVSIRAGGRVIARGELVDVDGSVGVRVTELT